MKEYIIDLFGDITNWGYSRNYIKYYLDQAGKNPVRLRVTSFGGNINEAIAISKLLEVHGDVTVEFIGFNASAVTWMAFGAKRIVAYEDTLWLAHKSSVAVSFYGAFNADSIEEKIKELQNKKQMAEALDLIIAKKYADYTGKTIEEIFGLMGESKWLTAQEAKDWGFVNEVLPGKMNKNSSAATNLFEAMGLPPVPEVKTDNIKEDTLVNRIVDGIKGIFKNDDTNHDKIINTVMNKEFLSVNKVLNIEGFEMADNKVTLTVEQMKIINTALTNAGQEIDQADNKYNGLLAKIDGLSDVVKNAADEDAKIEAIRDIVNKIPASVVNDNNGGNGNRTFNDVAVDPINRFDEE